MYEKLVWKLVKINHYTLTKKPFNKFKVCLNFVLKKDLGLVVVKPILQKCALCKFVCQLLDLTFKPPNVFAPILYFLPKFMREK